MHRLLTLAFAFIPILLFAQPKIQLVNFATGFDLPVDIAHCGDSRLFVVEREGKIWVLDSLGNKLNTFLDIDARVNANQSEQGLLGLAFDPNYAENGYFYVNYTKNGAGDTRVARFSVKANNPNEADPDSELTIIEQTQPYWNHNGGCLRFGPDGYLYISLGDGGSGGDPQNYGQTKKTFLGKILRIDVNNSNPSQPYVVPPDNPFVGNDDYFPEIWSLGWRNPWRFAFDPLNGDMWIADVGQNQYEELDFEPANTPGRNYGWRCYEGNNPYNTSGCQPASAYIMPFFQYAHSGGNGCSVTGGFVYRGSQFPDLYGCYLFADYCSGRWWYSRRNSDGSFTTNVLATLSGYEYSTFGEDSKGELYVALLSTGRIQRIRELCSPFQVTGDAGPAVCTGSMDGAINLNTSGAAGTATYLWSTGATTQNLSGLDPGIYTVEIKDGNNCIRRDTFEIANAAPAAPLMPFIDTAMCQGQPINFGLAQPPMGFTHQWFLDGNPILSSPGGTFFVQETGTYQVQLTGQGCNSELSTPVLVTVFPAPTISLDYVANVITATIDPANATVQWFFEQTLIPGATNPVLIAEQIGLYQIEVTDLVGCVNSAEITVVELVGTKLPANVRQFSLSPNPTENSVLLEMELENTGRTIITLSDNSQRQIFSQNVDNQKIALPIDLRNLPTGTYFITVQTGSGGFVRKVLKQ
jgi:glucose/arabinose dehydrogenase